MSELTRIAVIGSTAFSASDFIDYALENPGNTVLGISRSPEATPVMLPHLRHGTGRYRFAQLHLVKDSEKVISALKDFRPHYVVNFAAQGEVRTSFDHPIEHFETNALAMVKLTTALRKMEGLKRYLHISTPEVYGSAADGAVREGAVMNPSSPYAASKGAADLYLNVLSKTLGFPVTTIRASNVYGAHQQLYRIIPRTVIYYKLGKTLKLDGGGVAVKSFIHIRDISKGEYLAMTKGRAGEVYHLSPDRGVSIRHVVETICREIGADFSKFVEVGPERPGQDAAYILDSSKARSELGWAPTIGFDEGVRGVCRWIEANWDAIKTMPHDYIFAE